MSSYDLCSLLRFELFDLLGLLHEFSVEVHVIAFDIFHTPKMLSVIRYLEEISVLLIAVVEILDMDQINGLILVVCMVD